MFLTKDFQTEAIRINLKKLLRSEGIVIRHVSLTQRPTYDKAHMYASGEYFPIQGKLSSNYLIQKYYKDTKFISLGQFLKKTLAYHRSYVTARAKRKPFSTSFFYQKPLHASDELLHNTIKYLLENYYDFPINELRNSKAGSHLPLNISDKTSVYLGMDIYGRVGFTSPRNRTYNRLVKPETFLDIIKKHDKNN